MEGRLRNWYLYINLNVNGKNIVSIKVYLIYSKRNKE